MYEPEGHMFDDFDLRVCNVLGMAGRRPEIAGRELSGMNLNFSK